MKNLKLEAKSITFFLKTHFILIQISLDSSSYFKIEHNYLKPKEHAGSNITIFHSQLLFLNCSKGKNDFLSVFGDVPKGFHRGSACRRRACEKQDAGGGTEAGALLWATVECELHHEELVPPRGKKTTGVRGGGSGDNSRDVGCRGFHKAEGNVKEIGKQ